MRLKTKLFAILALLTIGSNAQNLILAKAFYKKAQQEYSNKNYPKVFKLIAKTKENLGGETNPEITYLEAKSHYNNDLNVATAKKLLLQFLEKADPSDSRIDEISSLIVDIETSDKIDKYGNFKDLTNRNGEKTSYYKSGEREWVQNYVKGVKNGIIKRYNKNGYLIQYGEQKNGYVQGFYQWMNDDGSLRQTNYYDSSAKKTGTEKRYTYAKSVKRSRENKILQYVYTYTSGKKNGVYKYYYKGKLSTLGNYKSDKRSGKFTNYHTDSDVISSIYTYNCTPCYDSKKLSYLEGVYTQYYKNGELKAKKNYSKGKLYGKQKYYYDNGTLRLWEHINTNGKLYGERAYYYKSNGIRGLIINYENGRAIEISEQVDVNGKKLRISKLKKGKGYLKRINDAGVLIYEATYIDGYLSGQEKTYNDEGILIKKAIYVGGSLNGKEKVYYDNGNIDHITIYEKGVRIGIKKYYNKFDGSIRNIFDYTKSRHTSNTLSKQTKELNKLLADNKSIEAIIDHCKKKNPIGRDYYLSEAAINSFGYKLMKSDKNENALKIFKLNIEFYPKAANTYDSYGECLAKLGKNKEAIAAYQKALELDPKKESARKMLKTLQQ